jgi:Na+-transporting NADH:ubiquinone oxidoreductase subunit NqrC
MEFTYEIDKKKAMVVSKENIIYGYGLRKHKAQKIWITGLLVSIIGIIASLIPQIDYIFLFVFIVSIIFNVLMFFKAEELQIKGLQSQTAKLYKNKSKLQRNVIIDENQITITYEGKNSKSFTLDSIKHMTYRSDLGGIFFSKSKLARFVFFVDLSNLEEETK